MARQKESVETKIIWGFGRFIKRLLGDGGGKITKKQIDRGEVKRRWEEIGNIAKQSGPQNFQLAVINADKLLDFCLKSQGARGETMGERLKDAESLFCDRASYQAAWNGHKARNSLVHDEKSEFLTYEANAAIEQFHKALQGLGIL